MSEGKSNFWIDMLICASYASEQYPYVVDSTI